VTILTGVDREAIERHDFPVGRRGYDQAAVDEHLRRVADEIEVLRASPGSRPPVTPISAGTSEQVRAILEAAETGAAELRADAGRQAGEHVARVEEAAGGMLAKLDELENQLTGLLDALRRSSEQLTDGLSELHEQVSEFGGAAPEEPPEPAPAPAPEAATIVPTDGPALNGDEAGARLIALNRALSGTPREETARYLAEHYTLADPDALLDDVYAQVDR
jgi:DivIVA domain-containing protein